MMVMRMTPPPGIGRIDSHFMNGTGHCEGVYVVRCGGDMFRFLSSLFLSPVSNALVVLGLVDVIHRVCGGPGGSPFSPTGKQAVRNYGRP